MSTESKHRMWFVDDSEADHTLYKLAFRDLLTNCTFESFYSAEDAVDALLDGGQPSLILLDLNMPGLGGMHFLRERQRCGFSHIPTLILTSSANPDDIVKTYELGANSYLEKPQDFASLKDFARSVSSYWFRWSHLPGLIS